MESHEGLSPRTDAAETLKDAVVEAMRMGFPVEIPGYTIGQPPLESKYEFMSGGATEIIKLGRTGLETPLVTLIQADSQQNGRTYEYTFTAIENGTLKLVRYNKKGQKEKIEIIGPWKPGKHSPDELGVYKFDDLPENIEPEKVARELLEGLRTRTFKPPVMASKATERKAA